MEYRIPYARYKYLFDYNQAKHQPYDYKRNGLLNKLLPAVITTTQNKTTKLVLSFLETVFIGLIDYVAELQHFKNWNYKRF